MKESLLYLKKQMCWEAVRFRLTNLPVLVFSLITLSVVVYYFRANSWQAALNPETIKQLMAFASLFSLVFYFAFGRFGLKMLVALCVMASIALIVHLVTGPKVSLLALVNDIVQRIVIIAIGLCLYLWDKEREDKAAQSTDTSPLKPDSSSGKIDLS